MRDFQGFRSLQEVECSGKSLPGDFYLTNLILYRKENKRVVVKLSVHNLKITCETFEDYSSCDIIEAESRKSTVRALISDLKEGERAFVGCNASGVFSASGDLKKYSWFFPVFYRRSKSSRLRYHKYYFFKGIVNGHLYTCI